MRMYNNPHNYVNIWEGRQFVHEWLGRVRRETSVRANKQSNHDPGGGGVSAHVWLIPCVLQLWVLLLYLISTLAMMTHGTSPKSLLWEVFTALPYFCVLTLSFFIFYLQSKSECSSQPIKHKSDSLLVHKRKCVCLIVLVCTWNFKIAQSRAKVTKWSRRGGAEQALYMWRPQPEKPHYRDSLNDSTLKTVAVISMLLLLAGDIETNPGPTEITLQALSRELQTLTEPIHFGVFLGIPQSTLSTVQKNHPNDTEEQKFKVFVYIVNNYMKLEITWEKIADALDSVSNGNLAVKIRKKFCQADKNSDDEYLSAEDDGPPQQSNKGKWSSHVDTISSYHEQTEEVPGSECTPESKCLPSRASMTPDQDEPQLPSPDPVASHHTSTALVPQLSTSDFSDESQSSQPPSVASSQSGANSSTASSQQVSYLRFECGCGKCSVYDYISGKICPNPKELPFPKLDVSEIPPEQIEYIEQEFRHQTVSIYREFCSLVSDTFEELGEKVNHLQLLSHLRLVLRPGWMLQSALSSSSESVDTFKNVNAFDLPKCLIDKNYCSWFDYDLIEHLRKRYLFPNVTDEDRSLSDYKEHFRHYVSSRCFIYLHDTGPQPENQVDVKCKLDFEYQKLTQPLIKHLKYVFAKTIGAPAYHLAFKTAREGCTELTFGAPPYFSEITKLSKYQISQLKDHGFIEVTVCEKNLLQSETNKNSGLNAVFGLSDDESNIVDGRLLNDSLSSTNLNEETDTDENLEADIDTTDIELSCTETKQVSYTEIIGDIRCKEELKFEEVMQLEVSPCTFWKVSHDGHPHMALVYDGPVGDKLQFSEFVRDILNERQNVLKASCIHLDDQISHHPILLFKPKQSLRDYCISREALSEVEQLSVLHDVAVGTLGFPSTARIKISLEAIFVHMDSKGKLMAFFVLLYKHSYFPQMEQTPEPPADYEWIRDALLLMHYRDQYNEHSDQELPQSHILYNIMKYKWFSDDENLHPKDVVEVAKEIHYILGEYLFAKTIGAPAYHLAFKTAREGCTELTFGAPPYFSEITKLSRYQISQLKDHGFIEVTVCEKNLLQSETNENSGLNAVSEVSVDESNIVDGQLLNDSLSSISLSEETDTDESREADIDTTDIELSCTETKQVSYTEIIGDIQCKEELKFEGKMELKVPPCTFWKVSHDGHPHMALVYNGPVGDKLQFSEFAKDLLNERQNVLKASCIHLDDHQSDHPILLFKPEQSLRDYCISREALSEVEQLSVLHDVAVGTFGFPSTARIKVTLEAIFVHMNSNGEIMAFFSPLYKHSYFPQMEQTPEPPADYKWFRDALLLMHYRDQHNEHSELPESHILYNIMKYKWFSGDENLHPKDVGEVAKEIYYILDLEKTRTELMVALSGSDLLEVSHLHMLLLGHTGVGKTSIRKHLQNISFDKKERSTIIMEQELCQVTIEALTDSSSSVIFQKSENVYKSEPDKVFLTLWDTGGQPMFQDLLPCFAKLRSIYGIVFRICDLMDDRNAVIRPVSLLGYEKESPYTYTDYINRCLAFIEFFSSGMHHGFSNLPPELKNVFVESIEKFPRVALIGTFKDTVQEDKSGERYEQLRETIQSFQLNFPGRVFCPSDNQSMVFEIDNTRSGQKHEDQRMIDLRKQIITCTQSAKAKIPSKWISFKVDLEREAQIQQPCTGIVTFEKATELAKKHNIDPKPALCYFHELGIFLWFCEKESLEEYVIVDPKCLVSILGTVLNPKRLDESPELWEELQMRGIINRQTAEQLFKGSNTGLPLKWILSFFEEHHLAMPLNEGYFIPSMLQVLKICPNHLHICDMADSVCTSLHHQPNVKAVPLFLVPKSKCIPPGFFPRLMTVLAGIQEGEIIWKVSHDRVACKNIVSFAVNDQACVVFTEFISCVRVHLISLSGGKISRELCQGILSQLKIQLQRVFPNADENLVSVTFACYCSKPPHFLLSWPSSTEDNVQCKKEPNIMFKLTKAHKIWLKKQVPKINSNEDAKKLFDTALKEGSVNLQVLTVVFTGSKKILFKQTIFEEPVTSTFYIVDGFKVLSLEPEYLEKFLASNATLPQEANSESGVEPVTSPTQGSPSKADDLDNSAIKKEDTSFSGYLDESKSKADTPDHKPQEGDKLSQSLEALTLANPSTSDNRSVLNVVERTDNILKRIHQTSKEQQSLKLLNAIECNELAVMRLLPLILQHAPDYGIGHTAESLETVVHISQKWLIVQTKEMVLNSATSIISHSHNLPFAIDISVKSGILSKDLALLSQNAKEKAIPYGWYYLCHCIQNAFRESKRNVFSMREISDIVKECHIPITNNFLRQVLTCLHKLGLLLYYESILPNVVFKDATLIITILECVINIRRVKGNPVGIISKMFFSTIEYVFVEGITYQDAIKLLQHLSIISPINSELLLMPTLLKNVFDEKRLSAKKNNPSLLIEYAVAPGVFEYLVCYLTSEQNEKSWPWKVHTTISQRKPTCLYKNCIELSLPGYDCTITIFQSTTNIRVYIEFVDSHPPFSKIRSSIVAGLKKAYSSYHYPNTLKMKLGFNCTCSSSDSAHIMVYDEQRNHLRCSNSPRKVFILSSTQQRWFEEGIAGTEDDNSLSLPNLFKFLLHLHEEWYQVGLKLGLTTRVLQNISGRYREKPDIALKETIKYWIENTPNPSWELLLKGLKEGPLMSYAGYSWREGAVEGVDLDSLIKEISDHIGFEWCFLARSLDFTQTDIDGLIYANQHNLREQIYQFFYQWKRRDGADATPDKLLCAAMDASLFELLKTLERKGFIKRCEPPVTPSFPPVGAVAQPSTPNRLDSDVLPNYTATPHTPNVTSSPNLVNLRSPDHEAGGNDLSTIALPPSTPNRLDTDVMSDSTNTTSPLIRTVISSPNLVNLRSPEAPGSNLSTAPLSPSTPNRLDADVMPDSTNTTPPQTQNVSSSPNLANPRSPAGGNDLSTDESMDESMDEREYVRRKRLQRLESNLANNTPFPDSSSSDAPVSTSTSSVPEAPPATLDTTEQPVAETPPPSQPRPPVCRFELDDMVMVERPDAAPWYGVVRWVGDLSERPGMPVVGVEMENEVPGGGDGSKDRERLFWCPDKHGLFLPVAMIKKDNRFEQNSEDSTSPPSQGPTLNTASNAASNVTSSEPAASSVLDGMLKGLTFRNALPLDSSTPPVNSSDDSEKVLVFTIPVDHAGLVIGREGRNIQEVERLTNTSIKMERDYGGFGGNKKGVIRGSEENQKKALQLILNRLKKRIELHTATVETVQIPEDKVGLVIGRGGQTVNAIKSLSGVVDIKVDDRPAGLASFSLFASPTRSCTITGSEKDIEKAKQLINLAVMGGNIAVGATSAALISDLANLGVEVEESEN